MIYETAKILSSTKLFVPPPDKFHIGDFCLITVPELVLCEGSHVNAGTKIIGREKVVVGKYSVISYDCLLLTSTDCPKEALASDYLPEEQRKIYTAPISIGEHVFVGAKSIVMPGVTIFDGAVIGAGSYIDEDVKDWTVIYPHKKPTQRNQKSVMSYRSPDHPK